MKWEQAQNTLPSLAKKFVAIFKFRPLSITFGLYISRLKIASLNHKNHKVVKLGFFKTSKSFFEEN